MYGTPVPRLNRAWGDLKLQQPDFGRRLTQLRARILAWGQDYLIRYS